MYGCVGCWTIAVPPSPKAHAHFVGDPVDVSVNFTASGAGPLAGVKVKSATGFVAGAGAGAVTVTVAVFGVLVPPAFDAVRVTV